MAKQRRGGYTAPGSFGSTPAEMERARGFLAQHGIDYTGDKPKQAQRLANSVERQLAAGLAANRQFARRGVAPEHPDRQAPKSFTPDAFKATGKPRQVAASEYQRGAARFRVENTERTLQDGRHLYNGGQRFAEEAVKDAAFVGARIDIKVTLADGSTHTVFTGQDHKRNGEHAMDAAALREKMEANDWDIGDAVEDALEGYDIDVYGGGGIVSYSVTTYGGSW